MAVSTTVAAIAVISALVGRRPNSHRPFDELYVLWLRALRPCLLEVQSVSHPSRVHLDIESDDIEAEAERLEKLGAKRIEKVRTWWVMEAPTGQRFCIVPPQRADG